MSAERRRGLAAWEWGLVAVSAAAGAYAIAGPSWRGPAEPDVVSALSVETAPPRGPVARIDDAAFRATCRELGLPDPPPLDGADPVPVRRLLEQTEAWARTRDPLALADLGRLYQALEEHRAALECFAALVELDGTNPEWRYHVGAQAQVLGLEDLALAALEESSRAEPTHVVTHARLGRLYLERGDLDRAEASYERCRELRPNQSLGYVGLARVALRRDDAAAAEALLRRAIRATPNDFLAYRLLSRALAMGGKPAEARAASAAAERYPRYEGWLVFDERLQASHALAETQRYLENQMRVAQGTGDTERLIATARALLERRPDDINTMGLLAGAYLGSDRLPEARARIDQALALKPDSVPMLCVSAQVAVLEGDSAAARAAIERALALNPMFAPAFDLDGRILFREHRYAEAIWCLRQAITLAPDADDTRLLLATMFEEISRPQDAALVLRALLDRNPAHPEARRRLAVLTGG